MIKPLEIVLSSVITLSSYDMPEPPQPLISSDYSIEAYEYLKDQYPKTDEEKLMDIIYDCILEDYESGR